MRVSHENVTYYIDFHSPCGRDSIIGWNLNQPEKHDGIEYWFIQGYVSKGMFKESHAVDEFQKLKPIIKSPPSMYESMKS